MIDFVHLKTLKRPSRPHDFTWHGHLYWFNEMFCQIQKSDFSFDNAMLDVCPLSGNLMYFDGYYFLKWVILEEPEINSAYRQWCTTFLERVNDQTSN